MEAQRVEIPKKKADIIKEMQPGESIDITGQNRRAWYNQAKYVAPYSVWRTVTIQGKVYLHRES
jgi:hypothetical protein